MTSICVTGGAGFIGSHVVRKLLERHHDVVVLDNLSIGRRSNISECSNFIKGDILDEDAVARALSGCEVLVHLAARVAIRSSIERVYDDSLANYTGTAQLLNGLQKEGASIKRVVFSSSMAVYGDAREGQKLDEETSLIEPMSPYGVSKLAAEKTLKLVCDSVGVNHTILRLFNTYGEGQTYSPYVGVLTIFANRLLKDQSLSVYGDGYQLRDYVCVDDVSDAIVAAAEDTRAENQLLNVGSGHGTTIWQLIEFYEQVLGRKIAVEKLEAVPGEMRNSVANADRLSQRLNIHPGSDIAASLAGIMKEVQARQST